MLPTRVHGKPVAEASLGVVRNADQSSRHVSLESVAGREIGGVRTPETKGHTEALSAAHGNVSAELARRLEQRQGKNVRRNDEQSAGVVSRFGKRFVIEDGAVCRRILNQRAENGLVEFEAGEI